VVTKLSKRILAEYMVTLGKYSRLYSTWLFAQKKKLVTFSIKLDYEFLKRELVLKEWKANKVLSNISNLLWKTFQKSPRFSLHLMYEKKISKKFLRKKKIKNFLKKRKIPKNIKIGLLVIIPNHKLLNSWLKDLWRDKRTLSIKRWLNKKKVKLLNCLLQNRNFSILLLLRKNNL